MMDTMMSPVANAPQVAVVDDDALFLETLAANLREGGFRVATFGGAKSALAGFTDGLRPLAILIEARQADRDNAALPRALRSAGFRGGIVRLTPEAPRHDDGEVAEWIAKTLPPALILHHLKRLIGRTAEGVTVGALALQPAQSEATWRGDPVDLSRAEFAIAAVLAERAGVTVGYREIFRVIRSDLFRALGGSESHRMLVRAAVERMRRKFTAKDPAFDAIEHAPGLGYRWRFGAGIAGATGGDIGRLYN